MVSRRTIIILCVLPSLLALCPSRKQYLNSKLQLCLNCTECTHHNVVLRPCDFNRDTVCGTVQEFLKNFDHNSKRHHHSKYIKHRIRPSHDVVNDNYTLPVVAASVAAANAAGVSVDTTEEPFTSAETLVWDWQAVALVAAVFFCILFFVVVTMYSLHQARQWKRLKDSFEADVEELSVRLSLMNAINEKEGSLSPDINSKDFVDAINDRCMYLEKILNGRINPTSNKKGNVYIEEAM